MKRLEIKDAATQPAYFLVTSFGGSFSFFLPVLVESSDLLIPPLLPSPPYLEWMQRDLHLSS